MMTPEEKIARRTLLKQLGSASLAALASGGARALANTGGETVTHPAAKADSCILIWLAGGMASPDTFDPKRYLPFEKGLDRIPGEGVDDQIERSHLVRNDVVEQHIRENRNRVALTDVGQCADQKRPSFRLVEAIVTEVPRQADERTVVRGEDGEVGIRIGERGSETGGVDRDVQDIEIIAVVIELTDGTAPADDLRDRLRVSRRAGETETQNDDRNQARKLTHR